MSSKSLLLLDTCAIIFAALGTKVDHQADVEMRAAAVEGRLRISPMSAWEIGMLMSKRRLRSPLTAGEFVERFLSEMSAQYCLLSPEILIGSSFLPGQPNSDPTDRILMASARVLDMVLVTRDGLILSYGSEGHVRTLAC